ncbi:MAG: ATP-binding protein [Candidatus Cloacimonetes bacterium]|nr:ATP-binding protein [Candidatus Cloacimonadota bacterium]
MIKRVAQKKLIELSRYFPVVTVTGPRQSGKTTLVKMTFPNKDYVNLENPNIREMIMIDPEGFFQQYPDGAILDEVQKLPQLFSYIQTMVDKFKVNGLFILTGSNQFEFMQRIGQSMAGRTAILKLLPFSYQEIYNTSVIPIHKLLFTGFYPRLHDQHIPIEDFFIAYVNTYIERDVRMIANVHNLTLFQNFLKVCAARTGSILNKTAISNEVGVSSKTVEEWLSILEASFLIYRMPPYFKNFNKRIIKSPKLYFLDVGLAAFLLGIQHADQLINHPLRGEIFESYVISELLKYIYNAGKRSNLYFFRESNQTEVDVLLDTAFSPVPVEIKSSATLNQSQFKNLNLFRKISTDFVHAGLVLGTDIERTFNDTIIRGYNRVPELYEILVKDNNFSEKKLARPEGLEPSTL